VPLAGAGPWLNHFEQASPGLQTALYTLASGPAGLSWPISAHPAPSLAQALRARLNVRMPDSRAATLRFYDARIVRSIAALLSSSQRVAFFVPTIDWITQINDRLTRVHPYA